MQLTFDRTPKGYTIIFQKNTALLAVIQLRKTTIAGEKITSCEVIQFLNGKSIAKGNILIAHGQLKKMDNPVVLAKWFFELVCYLIEEYL
jgi:hypothetical protein